MVRKYASRNPVFRRKIVEAYHSARAEGKSRKESYREARDGGKWDVLRLRHQLKKLKRFRGDHFTISDARQMQEHASEAMDIAVNALAKHNFRMSVGEAARVLDAYFFLRGVLPPASRAKFSYDTFLEYFYALRKKKGKRLNSNDVRKIVEKMGSNDHNFLVAALVAHLAGIQAPRSAGLLGPHSHEIYDRAKKEQRLNDSSLQKQMLMGELNHILGRGFSRITGEPGPRKEVKKMVRAMAYDEFPDSLKRAARARIPNWDSLPPEKKNAVLRARSKMELADHLESLFGKYSQVVKEKRKGWESSQWVLDSLRRAENRLFLADLAMKWFSPKKKK